MAPAMRKGRPQRTYADMLPLANRVRDHVEEACQRATHLSLHVDRGHDEREVLRLDAIGHLAQRVVHRASETGLGEDPLELLTGRLDAVVDDGLESRPEAVAGLEGGGEREQQIGKLVL